MQRDEEWLLCIIVRYCVGQAGAIDVNEGNHGERIVVSVTCTPLGIHYEDVVTFMNESLHISSNPRWRC